MRRAFGFCALLGLALCATPAGAAIEEYDTVSPINMTIDSFEYMNTASRDAFTEAMRHWSVAVYEMTNGRHRLGRVKIVQGEENREFAHVRWLENYHKNGKPHAETEAGAYVPYRQEAVSPRHAIKMSSEFLVGRNVFSSSQGPIDTGYTLAHECGHYVYGLFDEYDGSSGVGWFEGWMNPNLPRSGDNLVLMNKDYYDGRVTPIMKEQQWGHETPSFDTPGRAMPLNFSTDEHYGFDGTKCPEEYQTAQRRFYPRTVSCWSTLVSKELREAHSQLRHHPQGRISLYPCDGGRVPRQKSRDRRSEDRVGHHEESARPDDPGRKLGKPPGIYIWPDLALYPRGM